MKALICFHDHGDWWFSKSLRWGFRHVFVVVWDERGYWVRLDGMKGVPKATVEAGDDDLAGYYRREHGFTVIEVQIERRERLPFLMVGTCVGMAKAFLGIRAPWVITPYQFYRYLRSSYG